VRVHAFRIVPDKHLGRLFFRGLCSCGFRTLRAPLRRECWDALTLHQLQATWTPRTGVPEWVARPAADESGTAGA
jgi:hypothetical protein